MSNKGNTELTFKGFNELFEKNLKKYPNQLACYEAIESFHETAFGERKYNDWETFRQYRYQKLKGTR